VHGLEETSEEGAAVELVGGGVGLGEGWGGVGLGGDGRWRRDGDGLVAAAAWESPRTA
jgi:hypothetical protein